MIDMERLNEALNFYPEELTDDDLDAPIHAAARRYAAGTLLMWCEEHSSPANRASCTYVKAYWNEYMSPCRIVEKWISDPPEAIADARRTEEK